MLPPTQARDVIDPATAKNTARVLDYYGIEWVVFYKSLPTVGKAESRAELAYLRYIFDNAPPTYEDAQVIVWSVPKLPRVAVCGAASAVPQRMADWNGREITATGEAGRWMASSVRLNFFNPTHSPMQVVISSDVLSWQQPRNLQLAQNGQKLQTDTVGTQRQTVQWPVTLQPGANMLEFRSLEPGAAAGNDTRALFFYTFSLRDVGNPQC